jgi:hypothetical protein
VITEGIKPVIGLRRSGIPSLAFAQQTMLAQQNKQLISTQTGMDPVNVRLAVVVDLFYSPNITSGSFLEH